MNDKTKKMLEAAKAARQKRKEQGVKLKHQTPYEKSFDNPNSMKLAIYGKCWDCMGGGADGSKMTRDSIKHCLDDTCTLHRFRPYRRN